MANGKLDSLIPGFEVRLDGKALPPTAANDVVEVSVDQALGTPAMFTVHLAPRQPARGKGSWADEELFAEGGKVEILMGYGAKLKTVIEGEITGLELEYRSDQALTVTICGHDRLHRLLRGRKTRIFNKKKDSDVARAIAREAGLKAKVDDSGAALDCIVQHQQTDLEFLTERARRIGWEVLLRDKDQLCFRERKEAGGKTVTLAWDRGLLEFSPRASLVGQAGKVKVSGWIPGKRKILRATADAGELAAMGGSKSGPARADKLFNKATALIAQPLTNPAEAKSVADGELENMALAYLEAQAVVVGSPDYRAGTVIEIEGFGKRFSGPYYVDSTRHEFHPGEGYSTTLELRRNAT